MQQTIYLADDNFRSRLRISNLNHSGARNTSWLPLEKEVKERSVAVLEFVETVKV